MTEKTSHSLSEIASKVLHDGKEAVEGAVKAAGGLLHPHAPAKAAPKARRPAKAASATRAAPKTASAKPKTASAKPKAAPAKKPAAAAKAPRRAAKKSA